MTDRTDILRKIKALAEQAEGGEKEAAQAALDRIMKKYDLSESDIENERREEVFFDYSQEIERRLLAQIIYMVTGAPPCGCVGAYSNRKRKKLGADVSCAERLEIEANYAFFKMALSRELEFFFAAFVNVNNLFPATNGESESNQPSPKRDKERDRRVGMMLNAMEEYKLLKKLGESTEIKD